MNDVVGRYLSALPPYDTASQKCLQMSIKIVKEFKSTYSYYKESNPDPEQWRKDKRRGN